MSSKRDRHYRWFVEPLNKRTNETIDMNSDATVEFRGEQTCSDGQMHRLWQCERRFIAHLRCNQQSLGLRFKVFVQQDEGKIRPWTLDNKKTNKAAAH